MLRHTFVDAMTAPKVLSFSFFRPIEIHCLTYAGKNLIFFPFKIQKDLFTSSFALVQPHNAKLPVIKVID